MRLAELDLLSGSGTCIQIAASQLDALTRVGERLALNPSLEAESSRACIWKHRLWLRCIWDRFAVAAVRIGRLSHRRIARNAAL